MRKLIGRLLCYVGWHDWKYGLKPQGSIAIGWDGHWRKCRRCLHKELHYDHWGWR